jgi:hypothetical protein
LKSALIENTGVGVRSARSSSDTPLFDGDLAIEASRGRVR